jgi:hypothetical protein
LAFKALEIEEKSSLSDLKYQIDRLSDSGSISCMSSHLMHKIRISGNKGSHSEVFSDRDEWETHDRIIPKQVIGSGRSMQLHRCIKNMPALLSESDLNIQEGFTFTMRTR